MSRCDCDHCKDIRERFYDPRQPYSQLTSHDVAMVEEGKEQERQRKWAEVGPKLLLALKWQHGCMVEIAEGRGAINFETGSEMIRRLREAIREAEAI